MEQKFDYEKAFKKLVMQIESEMTWAKEDVDENPKDRWNRGAYFGYESLKKLADKIIKGKHDFENDESNFEEEFRKEYGL